MREQILYYAIKYQGEWQKITEAIGNCEPWTKIAYDHPYITIVDEAYPKSLKRLRYAPWILFYEGDLSLLSHDQVAIVGARKCDEYGVMMCKHVCALLKQSCVIVSGLAKGIDAIAHREALHHKTIAVIGCGIDVCYPKENSWLYQQIRKHHLLLSEYPAGVKPLAYHFPWRNRIIAGLSKAVVVIQARKRSGTLLTVNEALDLNIPIYCIPHTFDDPCGSGCNLLISQGANILVDDEDILAIL